MAGAFEAPDTGDEESQTGVSVRELVVREGRAHRGGVLLRLAGVAYVKRAEMVSALFRECGEELEGAFTVLSADGRVRIRNLSHR